MFFGSRQIVQGGGEIFPKVSPKVSAKFWEFKVSLKAQHYCYHHFIGLLRTTIHPDPDRELAQQAHSYVYYLVLLITFIILIVII